MTMRDLREEPDRRVHADLHWSQCASRWFGAAWCSLVLRLPYRRVPAPERTAPGPSPPPSPPMKPDGDAEEPVERPVP